MPVVVDSRLVAGHRCQLQHVKCGKERCRKCATGDGHGPYWYLYTRNADGKLVCKYIGKKLDPAKVRRLC